MRGLQQSHWTRFGTFHATCTYNALCLSLFTYAGHHNNPFAKCCFNRTVICSWTKFGTVQWTYSPNITFSDVLFRVSSLKIPVWWPRNRLRKKKFQTGFHNIKRRTDLSSIWRLAGPTFGTRNLVISREKPQIEVPDRALKFS